MAALGLSDDCEAQLAEVEMMEAAYGDNFALNVDASHSNDISFDILLPELSIRLHIPPNYPNTPIRFVLNSVNTLNNSQKTLITSMIQRSIDVAENGALGSMEICQMAVDLSREYLEGIEAEKASHPVLIAPRRLRIARFLIYFHHIMCGRKRVAIVEQARELGLGGFSKHGFPGIVIVEGWDHAVLEYVRRIQQLRWQQMVVRGEEFDDYLDDTDPGVEQQALRLLPLPFREISGDSMSEIATLCQEAGCRDLFMTSMKKY